MDVLKIESFLDSILIKDKLVRVNQWIQLSDLVRDDITKTKFWNRELVSPLEIEFPSDKDFSSIYIGCEDSTLTNIQLYSRLHRLLSLSCFKINKIIQTENNHFLVTDFLIINLEEAIESGEIIFTNREIGLSEVDIELLTNISSLYEDESIGLILENELENQLRFKYKYYINYSQKKWKINYIVPMFQGPINRG